VTDAAQIAIAVVTNVGVVAVAYFSYKVKVQSKETHLAVNSRMDEFKKMFQELSRAEGVIQEKKDEQTRRDTAGGNPQH